MLWVVNPHAVIVESHSSIGPRWRDRNRALVVLQRGKSLAIPSPPIAIGPVTIVGVARTLLGVEAGHDVPWPEALTLASSMSAERSWRLQSGRLMVWTSRRRA